MRGKLGEGGRLDVEGGRCFRRREWLFVFDGGDGTNRMIFEN